MAGQTTQWLEDHKDYPHDYCLIWPFARVKENGRGVGWDDKAKKSDWAHRLMCKLVYGPAPDDKPVVAHSCGNGDQGCVNPRHLRWADHSENQLERYRVHGRPNRNANGFVSMFTEEQIAEIKAKYGEFTIRKLAEMYGCSEGTIQYYLKYRDQRGHAGGKIRPWSPEEIAQLRDGIDQGMTIPQLADYVGRPEGAVSSRMYKLGLRSKSGATTIPA